MRKLAKAIPASRRLRASLILALMAWSISSAWAFRWDLNENAPQGTTPEDQARLIDEQAAAAGEQQRQVGQERYDQRMENQKAVADDLAAEAARRYERTQAATRVAAEHSARQEEQTHVFAAIGLTLVVLVAGVMWIRKRGQCEVELR